MVISTKIHQDTVKCMVLKKRTWSFFSFTILSDTLRFIGDDPTNVSEVVSEIVRDK